MLIVALDPFPGSSASSMRWLTCIDNGSQAIPNIQQLLKVRRSRLLRVRGILDVLGKIKTVMHYTPLNAHED